MITLVTLIIIFEILTLLGFRSDRFLNWLIKLKFYIEYFWLKWRVHGWYVPVPDITFDSDSFSDGQWNEHLPWNMEDPINEYNTYDKTAFPELHYENGEFIGYASDVNGFKQCYGRWYFKVKMDGYIGENKVIKWPAIWLFDRKSEADVENGSAKYPHYYEIDIELMQKEFVCSYWHNDHGNYDDPGTTHKRSSFKSIRFRRMLQENIHSFLIDWNKNWLKFYINGILAAKFRNKIHYPLQMIVTKCSISETITIIQ